MRKGGVLAVVVAGIAGVTGLAASGGGVAVATVESDNLFIRSAVVEVGARPNGSFGSDADAPAGWHGNVGNRVGFRSDRDKDGWGVGIDDGDFFLPGGPYEGWGVQVLGSPAQWNNDDTTSITGSFTPGGDTWGTWNAAAPVDGVAISQRYSVPSNGLQFLSIDVTLTNTNSSPVTVAYVRSFDPDNCQTRGSDVTINGGTSTCAGSYDTVNTIVAQAKAGATYSAVSATQDDGSYIDLRSADPDTTVYGDKGSWCDYELSDLFLMTDAAVTHSAASPVNTPNCSGSDGLFTEVGATVTSDATVGLVIQKTIAAGATVTFNVKYVLSLSAAAAVSDPSFVEPTTTPTVSPVVPPPPSVDPATTTPATVAPSTTVRPSATTLAPVAPAPAAPVPAREAGGSLPTLTPGASQVFENGVATPVDVFVQDETELVLRGDGFELKLAGDCSFGCTIRTEADGREVLELEENGVARVAGAGFMPGTPVYVWLFSEPTFLGELTVQADGSFAGVMPLAGVAPGTHTLQVNGTSFDGKPRTANLGVLLAPEGAPTPLPGVLPSTGVHPAMFLWVALFTSVGTALVWVSRRRPVTTR
jgi:hypothetical protein